MENTRKISESRPTSLVNFWGPSVRERGGWVKLFLETSKCLGPKLVLKLNSQKVCLTGRVVSKHLPCFYEWLYILLRRSSVTWSNSGSVNTERQVALIHTQHMYPNYKMYYAYESAMEGSKSIRKHESMKARKAKENERKQTTVFQKSC